MIMTVTMNPSIDKLYIVEEFSPHTVMRVQEVINTAGGKGLNVSRAAAIAGEKVTAIGFAGGYVGQYFRRLIDHPNITPVFTEASGETRSCINIRDKKTGLSTEFLEPGSPVSGEDLARFMTSFKSAVRDAAVITISGSPPPGTPKGYYGELISIAKAEGKIVLLDTSGKALGDALPARPTLIKPNMDEISQLLGRKITTRAEVIEAAKILNADGIAFVVVSLGKDGAIIACGSGVYQGVTPDIPVVNTVGCGDCMLGGFAVGFARGYGLEDTIRFALAAATANALTKETGHFRLDDLNRLLGQVEVYPC